MGYSHHWRQYGDFNKWDALCTHAKFLQDAIYPVVKLDDVEIDACNLCFDGAPRCERFQLHRVKPDNSSWPGVRDRGYYLGFCKTQYNPYDLMVTSILLVANALEPDTITYGSDGDKSGWIPAIDLVREICLINAEFRPVN